MSEFQNPEAQRLAEIATLEADLEIKDKELTEILDSEESAERELQRDSKQAEIDSIKAKLFELRNYKENVSALTSFVKEHKDEYDEFIEMGIPVDEYSIAHDVFQTDEIPDEYLEEVRRLTQEGEE